MPRTPTEGLADWQTGGLADWRTGGLAQTKRISPSAVMVEAARTYPFPTLEATQDPG